MTYAAIYIKKQEPEKQVAEPKVVQKTENLLKQAINTAKEKITNIDVKSIAKNMTLQSATDFTQKYATGALTTIINGLPVTNQMMADSLFNGLAPAMGLTAFQTGFNSVMEMKTALCAGNINVANFLQGFQSSLQIVQDEQEKPDYSKYGEEIVIDLLTSFSKVHTAETPDRRVQNGQTYNEYLHNLPLSLPFSGIIKDNKNYSANEFSDRLEQIMLDKIPITFRGGDKIYENYVFTSFIPKRETENGIMFDAEIKYIQNGDIEFVKVNIPKNTNTNQRKQITNTKKGQNIKNKTSSEKYIGIINQNSIIQNAYSPTSKYLNFNK